jgi:hypothetical protein
MSDSEEQNDRLENVMIHQDEIQEISTEAIEHDALVAATVEDLVDNALVRDEIVGEVSSELAAARHMVQEMNEKVRALNVVTHLMASSVGYQCEDYLADSLNSGMIYKIGDPSSVPPGMRRPDVTYVTEETLIALNKKALQFGQPPIIARRKPDVTPILKEPARDDFSAIPNYTKMDADLVRKVSRDVSGNESNDQVIKTRQANAEIQQALTEIKQMEKEIKDMDTCPADPKNSATFRSDLRAIIDDNKE